MTSAIAVVNLPGRGQAVRATRLVREGECVLTETPIAILPDDRLASWATTDHELRELVAQREVRSQHSQFSDECWWPTAQRASVDVIDRFAALEFAELSAERQQRWMSLMDAFAVAKKTPGGILRTNAYTGGGGGTKLFEMQSRFNHGCLPNVEFRWNGQFSIVRASRDIAESEELLISYLSDADLALSTEARRAKLKEKWGFVCECDRCGRAGDQMPAMDVREQQLAALEATQAALNQQLHAHADALMAAVPSAASHIWHGRRVDLRLVLASVRECAEAVERTQRARRAVLDAPP